MASPQADPVPVVLVVDDEPMVLDYMVRVLSEAGYQVQSAPSAVVGLQLARQLSAPPALLVTDLRMPGLGGADLAHAMTGAYPMISVLLVSATAEDRATPPWPFLQKPFTGRDLLQAVRGLIGSPEGCQS